MDNICCSPDENNQRCKNSSEDYNLCKFHADLTRPLYLKYKKYEERNKYYLSISNYIEYDVRYLLKIYNKLHTSYLLRLAHHTASYIPKLWDDGHIFYLERIVYKMLECEQALTVKFSSAPSQVLITLDDLDEEEESVPQIVDIETIKKENKKITDESYIWADVIPKLIELNEEQIKRRRTMTALICFNVEKVMLEGYKEETGQDIEIPEGMLLTICTLLLMLQMMKGRKDCTRKGFDARLFQGLEIEDLISGQLKYLYNEKHAKDLLLALIKHKENNIKDWLTIVMKSIDIMVGSVIDGNDRIIFQNNNK